MKTECESVTDVIEWLQSLSKYTSSLYSIQNIIDYYIKVVFVNIYNCRFLEVLSLIIDC